MYCLICGEEHNQLILNMYCKKCIKEIQNEAEVVYEEREILDER